MVDVLFPFIDDYPSVQNPVSLTSLLKLKKSNPNWKNEKHAEYLNLVECPNKKKKIAYNRQRVKGKLTFVVADIQY